MDIKKQLGEFISQKKREKEEEDNIRRERNEADRSAILKNVAGDLASALIPALEKHLENSQMTAQEIRNAIKEGMQDAIQVNMPEISMPEMHMPEIKVDVSAIERAVEKGMSREFPQPVVNIPETIFPEKMRVELDGVDRMKPLPMLMVDIKGKPMQFGSSVSGGGKSDFFTIKDIRGSTASLIDQIEGALKVTGDLSATLSLDYGSGEVGSNTARFVQATNATSSVNVVDAFGSTAVSSVFNADNRIRVSVETGGSGLTDAELRASSVPVAQASGAMWSTQANLHGVDSTGAWEQIRVGVGVEAGAIRTVQAVDAVSSVNIVTVADIFSTTATSNVVNPDNRVKVELPATSVTVSGTLTSTGAYLLNGDGTYRDTLPISGTVQSEQTGTWNVTNVLNSISVAIVDSGGVQYSTSNPVPIDDAGGSITIDGSVSITGSLTSTVAVGDIPSDTADTGSAPLKIGGIARTANPTAVAANDRVSATFDDVGRQVFRPFQVRDLIQTAYVSLSNGTETTLLAASAGSYHDLLWIMCANQSNAAVFVDVREVTAGNVVMTIEVPAQGTAGIAPPMPYPQSATGNNWTVDMDDITGTTVDITALFTREV